MAGTSRERYNKNADKNSRNYSGDTHKRKEQDSVIYIIIARDQSSYITSDIVERFV